MSLKVWLPLINNFDNQGIDITNPTTTGTTVSTSGPLGGSYSFDGTNDQIQTTYTSAENTMTVCMWVNFSKFSVHLLDMRNSSGVGYQPAYVSTSGVQVGGTSNNQFPYISYTFSTGTWYHLGIVYSSTSTKLYVNGTLAGEASNSLGYNYNMSMEVHLGSRYNGQNWFQGYISDFRIYNEALSTYEVKVISRGLLLHYTRPGLGSYKAGDQILDSSGYGRNCLLYGNNVTISDYYRWERRYGKHFNINSCYYSTTSPSSGVKTISFFIRTTKENSTVFFADYKSKLGFGLNGSGYIIASCDSFSTGMFDASSLLANNMGQHVVIRKNEAGTDVDLFINGVKVTTRYSNNYWTHSTDTLMIGQRSTGTPMNNADFNDFRMYATRLSDEDVLDLYHTSLKQLNNGKSSPFEIMETTTGKVQVCLRTGVIKDDAFVESTSGNKFKAAQVISNEFIER